MRDPVDLVEAGMEAAQDDLRMLVNVLIALNKLQEEASEETMDALLGADDEDERMAIYDLRSFHLEQSAKAYLILAERIRTVKTLHKLRSPS